MKKKERWTTSTSRPRGVVKNTLRVSDIGGRCETRTHETLSGFGGFQDRCNSRYANLPLIKNIVSNLILKNKLFFLFFTCIKNGGRGGIRTHGSFQIKNLVDFRFQPLTHSSIIFIFFGGKEGIRTPEVHKSLTCFPGMLLQPLGHLSNFF